MGLTVGSSFDRGQIKIPTAGIGNNVSFIVWTFRVKIVVHSQFTINISSELYCQRKAMKTI